MGADTEVKRDLERKCQRVWRSFVERGWKRVGVLTRLNGSVSRGWTEHK